MNTMCDTTQLAIDSIKRLLDDDDIPNTYRVMCNLRTELTEIHNVEPGGELVKQLLRCYSSSLKGCLHSWELHITNAIINRKNFLLLKAGVFADRIPDDHLPVVLKEGEVW